MAFEKSKQAPLHTPVSIITGFLGSGKTTLLNKLIKHPFMDKVAVLINEFGEVGLDHLLVEKVSEDIVLLQSGCICCQMKDDLSNTLFDLFNKRKSGEIEAFSRVLIETTGVADPAPVMQVIISDPLLSSCFRLDNVITLVDSIFGESQIAKHAEPMKQVALADRLIFTKTDIAEDPKTASLQKLVRQINPSAAISTIVSGDIHPQDLFSNSANEHKRDIEKWINKEAYSTIKQGQSKVLGQHCVGISSICISLDTPIDWEYFSEWLDSLVFSRAENIIRTKGILNITGQEKPLVIQGVQHIFYPPSTLNEWPTTDRQSHLVFITYHFDPKAIENSLKDFLSSQSTASPDTHKGGTQ